MQWIRLAFHQFPENIKIARVMPIFVLFKKDPKKPNSFSKINPRKHTPAFTDFLLSKYYLRLKDLERGYFCTKCLS